MLSFPKLLRYFMQRDGAVFNMVLRIFLRVNTQNLQAHNTEAAHVDKAAQHIGADAGADTDTQAVADGQSSPSKVIFHPASGIDETAVAQLQAPLRRRILRAFVGRGLLESFESRFALSGLLGSDSVGPNVRNPSCFCPLNPFHTSSHTVEFPICFLDICLWI
jgi:hypothetical protein